MRGVALETKSATILYAARRTTNTFFALLLAVALSLRTDDDGSWDNIASGSGLIGGHPQTADAAADATNVMEGLAHRLDDVESGDDDALAAEMKSMLGSKLVPARRQDDKAEEQPATDKSTAPAEVSAHSSALMKNLADALDPYSKEVLPQTDATDWTSHDVPTPEGEQKKTRNTEAEDIAIRKALAEAEVRRKIQKDAVSMENVVQAASQKSHAKEAADHAKIEKAALEKEVVEEVAVYDAATKTRIAACESKRCAEERVAKAAAVKTKAEKESETEMAREEAAKKRAKEAETKAMADLAANNIAGHVNASSAMKEARQEVEAAGIARQRAKNKADAATAVQHEAQYLVAIKTKEEKDSKAAVKKDQGKIHTAKAELAAVATTSSAAPVHTSVSFSMKVDNVDFGALSADKAMRTHFEEGVKDGIAAQAHVARNQVQLTLSAGSVAVHTKVSSPAGANASALQSRLGDGTALSQAVVSKVKSVPGIQKASTGPIGVSNMSAPMLESDADVPTAAPSTTTTAAGIVVSESTGAASAGGGASGGSSSPVAGLPGLEKARELDETLTEMGDAVPGITWKAVVLVVSFGLCCILTKDCCWYIK